MANEEKITPGQDNITDPEVIVTKDDVKQPDIKANEKQEADKAKEPDKKGEDPKSQDGEKDSEAKAEEKDAEGKVPDAYEKFSLPEGFEYDEKLAGEFGGVAKELGLSQDQAQKLVDHYIKLTQEGIAAHTEQLNQISEDWKKASETDKEFGGANLDANIAVAKKALDTFGNPELSKYLNESKLGNNPELIRFCWKVGKLLADDHQPDDQAGKMRDRNKKLSEDEVAKLLFGSKKK